MIVLEGLAGVRRSPADSTYATLQFQSQLVGVLLLDLMHDLLQFFHAVVAVPLLLATRSNVDRLLVALGTEAVRHRSLSPS